MLDIIKGQTNKNAEIEYLITFLTKDDYEGRFYVGYLMPAISGESTTLDALWISKKYGVLVFLIDNQVDTAKEDSLFGVVDTFLRSNSKLKKGRELAINVEVITYQSNKTLLKEELNKIKEWNNNELFDVVVSTFQSVSTLKNKSDRKNIKKINSRGSRIKWLDDQLSILDNEQERAIIEYSGGIQRIRGLAGSGKTIVLALKAAYLHTQNPDWDIVVTFNTRSLKQQFKDFITKFCKEKGGEPDWDKIKIVNAWGNTREDWSEKGIYYSMCSENNIEYLDFKKAEIYANSNGMKREQAFEAVCKKALEETKLNRIKEKYDVILIDEAQDLSKDFLLICHHLLKSPDKRLIYAYDELQRLNEGASLPNPKNNFNAEADDKILKRCYRNSKPLLVTAHALGFGIYRKQGLVQFFDDPKLWGEVGYECKEGILEANQQVKLMRSNLSSPSYLENISKEIEGVVQPIDDLLVFKSFKNKQQQAEWVAAQINANLKEDELLFKDILVINPLGLTTRNEVALVRTMLTETYKINGHIAGESDADVFFESNSITFTGIHRAKGNEVPMVYIINADESYEGTFNAKRDLIKRRNTLFTAITRSKAWVRVCGIGENMDNLIQEFETVKKNNFELHFRYPTQQEIDEMNVIHRDISNEETQEITEIEKIYNSMLDAANKIKSGKLMLQDLSPKMQEMLKPHLKP